MINATFLANIGRDPELKTFSSGKSNTEIRAAIRQRPKRDQNGGWIDQPGWWISVEVWNKTAEWACNNLRKGDMVLVSGGVEQETWQDRNTGEQRSKLKVVNATIERVAPAKPKEAEPVVHPQQQQAPPRSAATVPTIGKITHNPEDMLADPEEPPF